MLDPLLDDYIRPETKILLALSGGPDSIYLLHRLLAYRKHVPFLLEAAHLHHGLREEADRDLRFVEEVTKEAGVPLVAERADVRAYAKKHRLGIEEAGRVLRYRFFRKNKRPGGWIALAHHLDDQVETMLLRLIRGTGLEGMTGMKVIEGDLFRPLLGIKKEAILKSLDERKIPYVVDRTNLESDYTRNKLRLEIIPRLEAINPGFVDVMASFREGVDRDEDYLKEKARVAFDALKTSVPGGIALSEEALELHPSLATRVVRLGIEAVRGDLRNIGFDHIDAVLDLQRAGSGKGIDLPGLRVERSYDRLLFLVPMDGSVERVVRLKDGEAHFLGHRFFLSDAGEGIAVKRPEGVTIRTRRAGDRIQLKVGRKKVKDIFIDEKIPRQARDRWPLVVEDGEVIWVVGLRKVHRQEEKQWKRLVWIPSKTM